MTLAVGWLSVLLGWCLIAAFYLDFWKTGSAETNSLPCVRYLAAAHGPGFRELSARDLGWITPALLSWRWQRAPVRMHDIRQPLTAGPAARLVVDRIEQVSGAPASHDKRTNGRVRCNHQPSETPRSGHARSAAGRIVSDPGLPVGEVPGQRLGAVDRRVVPRHLLRQLRRRPPVRRVCYRWARGRDRSDPEDLTNGGGLRAIRK